MNHPDAERGHGLCPARGLFVTGNDTGVGKTYAACEIIRGLTRAHVEVAAYKPVASGCSTVEGQLVCEDALALWEATGRRGNLRDVCPQSFAAPLAPHLAARREGRQVNSDQLLGGAQVWKGQCDYLVVEGAGGLMSPLAEDTYNIDLAMELGYPVVVVVANQLGAINQCLQTVIAAATYGEGLELAGVILNDVGAEQDESVTTNLAEIESRCAARLLAHLQHEGHLERVDWAV